MTIHTDETPVRMMASEERLTLHAPPTDALPGMAALLESRPAETLRALKGPFALTLRAASGRTVIAVDRFAVNTLCWRIVGDELKVATRCDALADADSTIDPQAIFDYLFFHCIPSPRTIYKDVFRLPPGHYAVFEAGRVTVAPYWTPQFSEARNGGFDSLKAEFLALVEQAVSRQLDGGKAGCYLSGGTDSSTVAGMIRQATGQPAATYSIGFQAQGYDEMEFARIAAKRFCSEHHEYYVTPDDLVRSIGDVARHFDQPFGNSSVLPAYYCARMARDDGVTRLLAGDGGDELFGGNSRYAKQRVFGWYQQVPGALRSSVLEPLLERTPAGRAPGLRKAASYVGQAKVPMPDRLHMYNLLLRLGVADVLTPDFLATVDQQGPLQQQREVWRQSAAANEVNRTLAYDWRYTLAESDLPKVRLSAQFAGLSVGFPFLDDDLLEFSLRLPTDYKLRGLKLRWFFKEALRGFLPDEIITKRKQGFGLPFGVWLVQHEPLMKLATDSLHSLAERDIVRRQFIADLLQRRLAEHPAYYGEMVWVLMMLEQWMQGDKRGQFK